MASAQLGAFLRHVRRLGGQSADLTDAELLGRFADAGDEDAFAALLRRHGRLVWGVCRRALGHHQDAEDAFQATFAVLARKAASVRRRGSLACWLHGVAHRTALAAQRAAARRRAHERRAAVPPARQAPPGVDLQEALAIVDEEVVRLPEAYRAAFVLCCLEGKTGSEAARSLGRTVGAVAVALTRARKLLRDRLARRGVTLTSVLAGLALTRQGASAAVPPGLGHAAVRSSTLAAAGRGAVAGALSTKAAALTEGVVKTMGTKSFKALTALALAAGVLGAVLCWRAVTGPAAVGEPPAPKAAPGDPPKDGGRTEPMAAGFAWGKPVDGLQAGVGYRPGAKRAYPVGEPVPLVVKLRNVGDKPKTVTYVAGVFDLVGPVHESGDGKRTPAALPETLPARPSFELTLKPGEAEVVGLARLAVDPAGRDKQVPVPTLQAAPGSYQVRYEGFVKGLPGLATGQVEVRVDRPEGGQGAAGDDWPAAEDEESNQLVGAWQTPDGAGPTFLADGTGRNPDGSRFRWRLDGDILVAQAVAAKGPTGPVSRMPVLFTADGKERATLAGGPAGEMFHPYKSYKLGPDGKPDDRRTPEGRTYRRKVVEADDAEPLPTPAVGPNPDKVNRDAPPKAGAVRVGPNVQVSKARADVFHAEVVVAADPADPKRLVAASMYTPPRAGPADSKVIVYASSDGGATWGPTLERTAADPEMYADPMFAFGPGGVVFFGYMAFPSLDRLREAGGVEVVRSEDGGKTWGKPARIEEFHDRPFLAADCTGGKFRGRLYCVTHRGALASADGGKTFGALKGWPPRDGYDPCGPAAPVVLSDGSVVALHGGQEKLPAPKQSMPGVPPKAASPFDPRPGYFVVGRSGDGGATFSGDRAVAGYTIRGRWSNIPSLAVDPGSPTRGDHLYAVWVDHPAGKSVRVMFARSADKGATFSEPVVLSEQPDAPGPGGPAHDAFLPTVAVNKAGVVGVSWYDSRGVPEGGWDVRFRASLDGGVRWLPSVRVTEESTVGDGAKKRRFGAGHTAGLAASDDGVFHAVWVDGRTGVGQVWTATVAVTPEQ